MKNALVSLVAWLGVGTGTLLLSLFGIVILGPATWLFEKGSGNLLHGVSRLWAALIAGSVPLWEIQTQGLGHIQKGRAYIIVSNHQSLLDILMVLAKLPLHFKFIAKRELFWIPFLGWHMALAGYINLKRGDVESGRACLEKARGWLRRGVSVLFFPEGTRSPDGKIHEFKAGAFKLALEEKIDILPLTVCGTRDAIPKKSWYVHKRAPLFLYVHAPVSVKNLSPENLGDLRNSVREKIVSRFQKKEEKASQ